jgi:hypothetical protein
MANSPDVGVNCTLSIGATVIPANLQGCSPDVNRAVRPIVLALGLANNLVGYAPSTSAKSGFMVDFDVPYGATGTTATLLNALLASAGSTISMQFGTAGGVSVATCIASSVAISGKEGGNINCKATLESVALPTVGATVGAGTNQDVFKFSDVASITLPSAVTYTDVNGFSFTVKRNLAAYHGNSTTGIAKRLKITRTEVMTQAEYLKNGDGEGTAFLGGGTPNFCPTLGSAVIVLTQICATTPVTLTLTAANSFHQSYPKTTSGTEAWVTEQSDMLASTGAFTIA